MKPKQFIRLTPVLLLMATACSKTPVTPTPQPDPNPQPKTKLSKIEYDYYTISLTYNADSTIANFISTPKTDPTLSSTYFIQYTDGKLAEVTFGAKWKYVYTGNQLTKVESYNEHGVLKYQTAFVYNGNKVSEKLESLVTTNGASPKLKTLFFYNAQGNVSKKEMWQFVNGGWLKNEDILYPEYDEQEDVTDQFEDYPYLPKGMFSLNNPKKEVFVDADGTLTGTITYSYTYDNKGRVTNKKAVHDFISVPSFEETTKLFY